MSRQLSEIKILLLKLCWTVSTFLWISIHIEGCPFRSEDTPWAGRSTAGRWLSLPARFGDGLSWRKPLCFDSHLPTEAFSFWCPKVQSHPNWRQCWTSYIALHGIHRSRPGFGPSLNFPLYPLLLFPLHFHRCWPEKPSLMNILTATYHLRVCFTASPSVTRRKISICVDKSDRKRTCGMLMLWRGIYYY